MNQPSEAGYTVHGNRIRLLTWLVDRYDTEEQPVTPAEVANRFDSLESQCLLATVEGGYRPTVTARELLELDIDDDTFLVLDTGPENEECAER
jgi:predicted transcriptional regulator